MGKTHWLNADHTPHDKMVSYFENRDLPSGRSVRYVQGALALQLDVLALPESDDPIELAGFGDTPLVLVNASGPGRRLEDGRAGPLATESEAPSRDRGEAAFPAFIDHDKNWTSWRCRSGAATVRANDSHESGGLWLCEPGRPPRALATGGFRLPVTSADGRWVVAGTAAPPRHPADGAVSIEVATGRRVPIQFPADRIIRPLAWVGAHRQVLLHVARGWDDMNRGTFHLVDPATGAVRAAPGDASPWLSLGARPFQPCATPGAVWVAVPANGDTTIARYDLERFALSPVLTLPGFVVQTSEIWADTRRGWLYFAYHGRVARVKRRARWAAAQALAPVVRRTAQRGGVEPHRWDAAGQGRDA